MPCNVFELLASLVVANFQNVDFIVAFDAAAGRLFAISITDVIRKNFDNLIPIKRVAEIQNLGSIKFVGMKDFMSQNPNSCIENYIEAKHTRRVFDNFDTYLASYIHLYRVYKCLSTLVENNHINLVDTFIDCCMTENTDHPATIAYSDGAVNEVLRLRKETYRIIKKYLVSHDAYKYFLALNRGKCTDQQFRMIRNIIKDAVNENEVSAEDFILALANVKKKPNMSDADVVKEALKGLREREQAAEDGVLPAEPEQTPQQDVNSELAHVA